MKGLIITHKGIEDISKKEIKELINQDSKNKETVCIFDIKKNEDLCRLCYSGQSFIKVLYYIDSLKVDKKFKVNLKKKVKEIKFDKFINKKSTFKVKCVRIDSDIISSEIENVAGSVVDYKVDLENPDLIVYIYIYKDDCYIGIDFSGFDLSKREYKIFNFPFSLKGTVAYSLVRMADYNKKEKILDPFCSSGEIMIETALFASGMSLHYYSKNKFCFLKFKNVKFNFEKYDKTKKVRNIFALDHLFRFVKATEKNAKIAGINKNIKFSRIEVEWLDTKFKEKEIDKIVTKVPIITKVTGVNVIEKLYKELFYQCEYILNDKGKIILLTKNKDVVKKHLGKFKVKEEREIWQGKEKLDVLIIGR